MIAVEGALVVLRRYKRERGLAVAQSEEARLLAVEKFLDHHFAPRRSERAGETGIDGALGFFLRRGDDDAFAGRESVGLDHDRKFLRRDVGLGGSRIGKAAIGGGGNAIGGTEILGEAFRAFEPRRLARRPEYFDPGALEIVGETGDERRLGSDHHEPDPALLAEADDRG